MELNVKKNTLNGAISGVINKITVTILPFIMRTIMIHYMGTEYLGLSALFLSVLNMLSLAELGFGGALVYSMYKPIAENDTYSICAILGLYRKIYNIIGTVILVIGMAILPFLNCFIRGTIPNDVNIYILYCIYLLNTVVSYFLFAYKNSLLIAFQRNDLSNNVSTVLTTIEYSIQIGLVIYFRNYYFYVIIFPVFTIIGNIVRAIIVNKRYPEYTCKGIVEEKQKKEIYKKTFALACHKIGNTISTSLDNMIVSAFLGLSSVAIFGNYNYVVSTVMSIIWIVYYSMTSGIGNRMNLYGVEENYNNFRALTSFNNCIRILFTGYLLFLYQPFIELWTGRSNLLNNSSVIVFSIYFYVYQSRKVVLLYKDAAGLWNEDQWKPLIGAIFNLCINILLVKKIGINGVIISSVLSFLLIEIPWETFVLYKKYFSKNVYCYFEIEIKTFIVALPCWIIIWLLTRYIYCGLFLSLILRGLICTIVSIPYLFLMYYKDDGFKSIISNFLPKIKVKS